MERNDASSLEPSNPVKLRSVERALTLIRMLMGEKSLSVTEAARELQVNASTAQRLLATLVVNGFAVQRPDRRYAISPSMTTAGATIAGPPLSARLRPYLEKLFEATGETVHIATLAGTRIQHLDGIEATHHALRFGLRVGVWLPAHLTSGGKVLLANLPDHEVDARYQMVLTSPRRTMTDVDLQSLHEQLDDIRDSGVGWNFEESEPGLAAMAISTGEIDGQRAALSVALPIARFSSEKGKRWSAALLEIAETIRGDLGAAR